MNKLKLYVEKDDQIEEIYFEMRRMVNVGYTGRNQEAIEKHIGELKREGIPTPKSIPTAYEVISKLIYFDDEIEVIGHKTSGEAEFVLLCTSNDIYVGVGSDHTDRELESVSVLKSKQVCPNIMSSKVWKLDDVRKDWDDLILRSWVKNEGGERILYQEALLSALMTPEDLMEFIKNKLDDRNLNGVVVYSGTVSIIPEKINYSNYFEVELYRPKMGRRLNCAYKIRVLDYLKGQANDKVSIHSDEYRGRK